jgi:hypothetical protein
MAMSGRTAFYFRDRLCVTRAVIRNVSFKSESNASALVPARKSSNGVQPPRLFFEMSPSARAPKGVVTTEIGVAASRSCSKSAGRPIGAKEVRDVRFDEPLCW